jgi:hypothetical protein
MLIALGDHFDPVAQKEKTGFQVSERCLWTDWDAESLARFEAEPAGFRFVVLVLALAFRSAPGVRWYSHVERIRGFQSYEKVETKIPFPAETEPGCVDAALQFDSACSAGAAQLA